MTVITVVAIAAVGLLFTVFVWPNIQTNLALSTACSQVDNNGDYVTEDTTITSSTDGYISCDNYICLARYNSKNYTRNCK